VLLCNIYTLITLCVYSLVQIWPQARRALHNYILTYIRLCSSEKTCNTLVLCRQSREVINDAFCLYDQLVERREGGGCHSPGCYPSSGYLVDDRAVTDQFITCNVDRVVNAFSSSAGFYLQQAIDSLARWSVSRWSVVHDMHAVSGQLVIDVRFKDSQTLMPTCCPVLSLHLCVVWNADWPACVLMTHLYKKLPVTMKIKDAV